MATEGGVGGRLKLAIHRRGLGTRQAIDRFEIAKVPGSSQGNFYRILKNETEPKTGFIIGASRELGVSAGWLLTGEGEMAAQAPLSPEDVERLGLFDLPELTQDDVVALTQELYGTTDRSGLTLEQRETRIDALSQGIAAWLRIPLLHSDKFRRAKMERGLATAFCDVALRALRLLIREPGDLPTPGSPDRALAELAKMERRLAGREKYRRTRRRATNYTREVLGALERGEEPPEVEVARLSADQEKADELSEDHRTRARQDDEVKEQLQEILRLNREGYDARLPDLLRDVIRTLTEGREPPPGDWQEPLPTEPGPAVLGEEYSGPPVETDEFTPEEKKALAERERPKKQEHLEAAKRDQRRP